MPPAPMTCPGSGIIAHSGDSCLAAGVYSGVPPGGVAFSASGGGVITSTSGVSITTPPLANAYGVHADGGGQINLTAGIADVQTSGAAAYDFFASNGGAITFAERENQEHRRRGIRPLCERRRIDNHGERIPDHPDVRRRGRRRRRRSGGAVSLMNGGQYHDERGRLHRSRRPGEFIHDHRQRVVRACPMATPYLLRTPAPPSITAPASATRRG